jgi:translation initiation factor IF-3
LGDNVEPGVYPIDKARQIAAEQELDLVVISDKAEPFIARFGLKVLIRAKEKAEGT